ncbi:MAG: leucine-rich repeat domain-containing protein [Limisphaerales bacterium]
MSIFVPSESEQPHDKTSFTQGFSDINFTLFAKTLVTTAIAAFSIMLTASANGQSSGDYDGFEWYSDDGQTAQINGYDGSGGDIAIPSIVTDDSDDNYTVTSIGDYAFAECYSLTSLAIPGTVTNIGGEVFMDCVNLTMITVDASSSFYASSPDGVVFDKSRTTLVQYPPGDGAGSYAIPSGVTNIVGGAFMDCISLTNITIPNSINSIGNSSFEDCDSLVSVTVPNTVTNIGDYAFAECDNLASVYFTGNAPTADWSVFEDEDPTIYYLSGTTGWADFSANTGLTPVLWNPLIQTGGGSFGISNNQFAFNISNGSTTSIPIAVEACTNLCNPIWIPLTNVMLTTTFYFSDPQWTNYKVRYYGLGFP